MNWVRRVFPGAFDPEMPWLDFLGLVEDIPTILAREASISLDVAAYHAGLMGGDSPEATAQRQEIERRIRETARWDDAPEEEVDPAAALEEKKARYRARRSRE